MPFKGDMRLGGPHDNEANLNGSSEMDGAPSAGTLIRTEQSVLRESSNGGSTVFYYGTEGQPISVANTRWSVPVRADGVGGEYLDWDTASNMTYLGPSDGQLPSTYSATTNTVEIDGITYSSGYSYSWLLHDGYGGTTSGGYSEYTPSGTLFLTKYNVPYSKDYFGSTFQVGHSEVQYFHNGSGGYTTLTSSIQYFENNTILGSITRGIYVLIEAIGGERYAGYNTYEVYISGGEPVDNYIPTATSYLPSGTRVEEGYDYFWNGEGGYYFYSVPSSGTSTGNTSSGSNFVEINGSNYSNGTYSGTEYHDGSGGTYWEYSYAYESYGYVFTSEWIYDMETSYGYTLYYKSNGSGGYYTET
jgi:hypothetical protein